MLDVVLKRFEKPDEIHEFQKGRFEIVRLGAMTIGRATYQPGWHLSVDVAPPEESERRALCSVEALKNAGPKRSPAP